MFMVGIGVFAAASLAVGLAQSPAWMVAARAVQGVGAAILAPSTLALLSTSFPEGTQRTKAMAAYGALAGLGTAFGLIVGGVLTTTLSWRIGFLLNVPVGLAAILAAPRVLPETVRHAGSLNVSDALSSTVGVSAVVFGIVHSADAGWGDPVTVGALLVGLTLVGMFVVRQHRAGEPLMPLRLFADRERAGAYAARFLFNGALVSWFFFMTQYLQGVSGFTPLEAGLAFLPVTGAAFAAAGATSRLTRRVSPRPLTIAACVSMLTGTALTSRVSPTTGYVLGIALPMLVFGIGQGLGLSTLTLAGMAGVAPQDAGVAGALVNVAHHLGGALGLGILITVFDAAGAGQHGRPLLAERGSASLPSARLPLIPPLLVTLLARPHRRAETPVRGEDAAAVAATVSLGPPTGSPASLSSSRAGTTGNGAAANRFSGSPVTRGEHVTDEQYAGGRSA